MHGDVFMVYKLCLFRKPWMVVDNFMIPFTIVIQNLLFGRYVYSCNKNDVWLAIRGFKQFGHKVGYCFAVIYISSCTTIINSCIKTAFEEKMWTDWYLTSEINSPPSLLLVNEVVHKAACCWRLWVDFLSFACIYLCDKLSCILTDKLTLTKITGREDSLSFVTGLLYL